MHMSLLVVSIALLVIAPIVYESMLKVKRFWGIFERILHWSIGALVVLHLLPESLAMIGWPAVLLAFLGLMLPGIGERLWSSEASTIHNVAVLTGIGGILMHGFIDGAALATPAVSLKSLPMAVLLHRLPTGMLICSMTAHEHRKWRWVILLGISIASVIGFFASHKYFSLAADSNAGIGSVQAVVAGSLLHVVFDEHEHEHEQNEKQSTRRSDVDDRDDKL